jgi:uncharacterized membrane protein YccC
MVSLAIPPTRLYAGRVTLAALLSLYVAYRLELESPYSAAVTAVIVANPMHGMVWSKSLYRLTGTLAGAIASLVLMGAFGQSPPLFSLGLAVWMGLCTAASTLLRNFRSYGAVLAGYTVALVAVPAVDDPLSIFDRVTTRGSVVVVGILCSAFVSSLLSPRTAERSLRAKLAEALADLGRYCLLASDGAQETRKLAELRPRVGFAIHALNNLVEFAATERPELARLADTLGVAINGMLGTISAATSVHTVLRAHLGSVRDRERFDRLIGEVRSLLERLVSVLQGRDRAALLEEIAALQGRFAALGDEIENALPDAETALMAAYDRLDDMLDELALGLDCLSRLLRRDISDLGLRTRFHLDWRGALVNGARAAIAVLAVCGFWYYSAWPNGGSMILAIVPAVGLFATRDTPEHDSMGFAYGATVAIILAIFYLAVVLPPITGFLGLACVLAPVIFVGALLTTYPSLVFFGVGFSVFFITELAPSNPMVFDMVGAINNGAALVLGGLLTAVVYRLVLPVDPRARVRTMVRIILGDVAALARASRPYPREAWESRMHDRLVRMRAILQTAGLAPDKLMHGAFGAFRLGREILRMRLIVDDLPAAPAVEAAAHDALLALEHVQAQPQHAAEACRHAAEVLRGFAVDTPRQLAAQFSRAAASFLEMALLIDDNRRFIRWGTA